MSPSNYSKTKTGPVMMFFFLWHLLVQEVLHPHSWVALGCTQDGFKSKWWTKALSFSLNSSKRTNNWWWIFKGIVPQGTDMKPLLLAKVTQSDQTSYKYDAQIRPRWIKIHKSTLPPRNNSRKLSNRKRENQCCFWLSLVQIKLFLCRLKKT